MSSTQTAYNPDEDLNSILLDAGVSKTVYALVTPQTEAAKEKVFGNAGDAFRAGYFEMFREPWTHKQDEAHEVFFDAWHEWSKPVVDFDRRHFPFYYPCNGASEAIRHLIYKWAAGCAPKQPIHVFKGEYEGYKAMAEAAGIYCVEHDRSDWTHIRGSRAPRFDDFGMFYISAPSAIDGNVWEDFNAFLDYMPERSVVVDATYVGAVPESAIRERFNLNAESVRTVIFSLSKPFGVYYDRIGGVFMRNEDPGLFGNRWFKNLTSLRLGTALMQEHGVYDLPNLYQEQQRLATAAASAGLGFDFTPSDVYLLATAPDDDTPMADYLRRDKRLRVCLTPTMDALIRAAEKVA